VTVLIVFDDWYTVATVLVHLWWLVHCWYEQCTNRQKQSKTVKGQSKQQKWPLVYQSSHVYTKSAEYTKSASAVRVRRIHKTPIVVNRHRSSKLLSFWENRIFAFWRQDPRWRISAILDFRGAEMGSLKSPCTTSYRSLIQTIVLNCLVFEKIAFFAFWRQTDRQTN